MRILLGGHEKQQCMLSHEVYVYVRSMVRKGPRSRGSLSIQIKSRLNDQDEFPLD